MAIWLFIAAVATAGAMPPVAMPVAFCALAFSGLGLFVYFTAAKTVQPVTIVPDDGGKLSHRLREWITKNRGTRLGRAFRSVGRGFGKLITGIGFLCCAGAGATTFTQIQGGQNAEGPRVPFIVLFCSGITGMALYGIGKAMSARRAVDILDPDGARPILFLRSFGDDGTQLPIGSTVEQNINPLKSQNTLEETLVKTFGVAGPVVAVGRPGQKVPTAGAARAYLSNDEWQEWVADLLEWSQQVVMLMGSPNMNLSKVDGLAWEIQHVYRNVAPQKIILLISPRLSESEVYSRWKSYRALVSGRFPDYLRDAILIRYDANWQASVVCAKNLHSAVSETQLATFRRAITCARDWTDPYGMDVFKLDCNKP